MGKGNIRPTIRRSDTQRWYDLSDDEFERLCYDLHGVQKEVATCQLHGSRGQRDKGVDHIAQRKGGNGKEVGQSKCYKKFNEKYLKDAVKLFLITLNTGRNKILDATYFLLRAIFSGHKFTRKKKFNVTVLRMKE